MQCLKAWISTPLMNTPKERISGPPYPHSRTPNHRHWELFQCKELRRKPFGQPLLGGGGHWRCYLGGPPLPVRFGWPPRSLLQFMLALVSGTSACWLPFGDRVGSALVGNTCKRSMKVQDEHASVQSATDTSKWQRTAFQFMQYGQGRSLTTTQATNITSSQ